MPGLFHISAIDRSGSGGEHRFSHRSSGLRLDGGHRSVGYRRDILGGYAMLKIRMFALAAAVTAMGAAPALAARIDVGQVRFGTALDHGRLRGPSTAVRSLTLTARNNPMYCRSVRVHFRNGDHRRVFSGRLGQGRPVHVDLPGRRRHIRSISFRCRATHNWAYVEVDAHTGRRGGYGPGPGPGWGDRDGGRRHLRDRDRWQRVGVERFEGRHDRESTATGWAGRLVDRVALRPLDNDARCRRVVAQFRHDERRELGARRYGTMRRGRYYVFDLPGGVRNLVGLHMACRARGDYDVRIEILTRSGR